MNGDIREIVLKAKIDSSGVESGGKDVQKSVNKMARTAEKTLEQLYKSIGDDLGSVTDQVRESFAEALFENAEDIKDEMDLSSFVEDFADAFTEELHDGIVEAVRSALDSLPDEVKSVFDVDQIFDGVVEDLETKIKESVIGGMSDISDKVEFLPEDGGIDIEKTIDNMHRCAALVRNVKAEFKELANVVGMFSATIMRVAKVVGTIGKVVKGLGQVFAKVFKLNVNIVKKFATSVMGIFKKLTTHATKTASKFGSILKAAIGIGGIMALFRKIKSDAQETIKILTKYDEVTNKNVSELTSSLKQLKGAIGAAFEPFANAVMPIITRVIQAITELVNKIAMFNAALMGQTTVKQAIYQYNDYAEAVRKAENAHSSFLTGLDEVRKPGSKANDGFTYGTVDIDFDTPLTAFAKKLRDLFKDGDYFAIGRFISDALAEGLTKLNGKWPEIQRKAREIGKNISEAICGFVSGAGDDSYESAFEAAGKTISNGLNTIIGFIDSFLVNTMGRDGFKNFGTSIKEMIVSAMQGIDWNTIKGDIYLALVGLADVFIGLFGDGKWLIELAANIGGLVRALCDGIVAAVNRIETEIGWDEIGRTIARAFEQIPAESIGEAIASIINAGIGLLEGLFSSGTDKQSSVFGTILTTIFKNVKINRVGLVLKEIIGKAVNWLKTVDWAGVGRFAGDVFAIILGDKELIQDIIGAIKTAFGAAWDALGGFWGIIKVLLGRQSAEDRYAASKKWADSIWGDGKTAKDSAAEYGDYIVAGLSDGISSGVDSYSKEIEDSWDRFDRRNADHWEINSPSKLYSKYGGFLVAGLQLGISNAIDELKSKFSTAWGKVTETFNKVFGIKDNGESKETQKTGGSLVSGILSGISDTWDSTKKNFETKFSGMVDSFKGFLGIDKNGGDAESTKPVGTSLVSGLYTGLSTEMESKKKGIGAAFSGVIDTVKDAFGISSDGLSEKTKTIGGGVVSGLETGITSKTEAGGKLKTFFGNIFSDISDTTGNTVSNMASTIVDTFSGVSGALKNPLQAIVTVIYDMVNNGISGVNSLATSINSIDFSVPNNAVTQKLGIAGAGWDGTSIKTMPNIPVPLLAGGAVIPPNKEFLAVLGDQTRGNNIEAPEDLIRQIVREESGGRGNVYHVEATANRRVLFDLIISEGQSRQQQSGRNPFDLA